LASDFQILGEEKIPVEVTYRAHGRATSPYDENRILVVKYLEICRDAGEKILGPRTPLPRLGAIAIGLSRVMAVEGAGRKLAHDERQFIDEGTAAFTRKITAWQKERRITKHGR
jgi:hypothetical protein